MQQQWTCWTLRGISQEPYCSIPQGGYDESGQENQRNEGTNAWYLLNQTSQRNLNWYPDLIDLTTVISLAVGRKEGSVIQNVPHQEEPVKMEGSEFLKLRPWIILKDWYTYPHIPSGTRTLRVKKIVLTLRTLARQNHRTTPPIKRGSYKRSPS